MSNQPATTSAAEAPSTRRRWTLFLVTLLPIAALVTILALGIIRSGGSPGGLLVNTQPGEAAAPFVVAPGFTLQPLDGGPALTSDSLKGKVVVLDFWSSWCPPCRAEAADLASVYREYAGMPVEFVGVAIWDNPADVLGHISRYSVSYPNAIDARGNVAIDYGVRGIPEKYFIDQHGNVVKKYVGPISRETLRGILDQMLGVR